MTHIFLIFALFYIFIYASSFPETFHVFDFDNIFGNYDDWNLVGKLPNTFVIYIFVYSLHRAYTINFLTSKSFHTLSILIAKQFRFVWIRENVKTSKQKRVLIKMLIRSEIVRALKMMPSYKKNDDILAVGVFSNIIRAAGTWKLSCLLAVITLFFVVQLV